MALGKVKVVDAKAVIRKNSIATQTQSGATIPFYNYFKRTQNSIPSTWSGVAVKK